MKLRGTSIRTLQCAAALSLGLACSQVSRADNCSGYIAEVNRSYEQSLELNKTNRMSSFTSYDIITSGDNPNFDGRMGECHGTWLVMSNGDPKGGAYCAFTDKDGDTAYVQWEVTAQGGTWKGVGGTGKWADNVSAGWTKRVARDDKRTLLQWGGICQQ